MTGFDLASLLLSLTPDFWIASTNSSLFAHQIPCFTSLCLRHWGHFEAGPFGGTIWAILPPLGLCPQWAPVVLSPLQAGINSFHSRKNSASDDTIMRAPHKSYKLRMGRKIGWNLFSSFRAKNQLQWGIYLHAPFKSYLSESVADKANKWNDQSKIQ